VGDERIRNEGQIFEEVYNNALALYAVLRTSQTIRVKRADMRQGEVVALPVDYCCDIEYRAKQILDTEEEKYFWYLVQLDPDDYPAIPQFLKQKLGKIFKENRLGVDGDYRKLYYRVKNMFDRKKIQEAKENEDGPDNDEQPRDLGDAYPAGGRGNQVEGAEAGISNQEADCSLE